MKGRTGGMRWPYMDHVKPGQANVIISGKIFRTVTDQCWNPLRRMEDMEREGVEQQVLSIMPELFNYWAHPEDALLFCRSMNETIARMVRDYPDKFIGLGSVPLQDPELAARELEWVRKVFGLAGVQIGTNVEGIPIGDPRFLPFFAMAEKLNIAVFVHPINPPAQERIVGPKVLNNFIGFPTEIAYAAASIITGLVLEKFPKLKICFSHGGGSFSTLLPRLTYGWETMPEFQEALPKSPMEYAKKLYFDTLVYHSKQFTYLSNIFSVNQLIVGSDYPFVIRETPPGKVLNGQAHLTDQDLKKMRGENAVRFLFRY